MIELIKLLIALTFVGVGMYATSKLLAYFWFGVEL